MTEARHKSHPTQLVTSQRAGAPPAAHVPPHPAPAAAAIFKCLLALKTRNAIILCPHPRATKCTVEAARIVRDAAVAAGAPAGVVQWIEAPSLPVTQVTAGPVELAGRGDCPPLNGPPIPRPTPRRAGL